MPDVDIGSGALAAAAPTPANRSNAMTEIAPVVIRPAARLGQHVAGLVLEVADAIAGIIDEAAEHLAGLVGEVARPLAQFVGLAPCSADRVELSNSLHQSPTSSAL